MLFLRNKWKASVIVKSVKVCFPQTSLTIWIHKCRAFLYPPSLAIKPLFWNAFHYYCLFYTIIIRTHYRSTKTSALWLVTTTISEVQQLMNRTGSINTVYQLGKTVLHSRWKCRQFHQGPPYFPRHTDMLKIFVDLDTCKQEDKRSS